MAPRKAPQKSLFGSQKWYFPYFPFRGSVGGRPVRKANRWTAQKTIIVTKCQQITENCPKIPPSPCDDKLLTFFGPFCLFGQGFHLIWETDFLPLLVLARLGPVPVKISTGKNFP